MRRRSWLSSKVQGRPRNWHSHRLWFVEPLESRALLAAVPVGAETLVNTYTTDLQRNAAVASDALGNYVITWQSNGQDGSGYGVYAQRYNAAGVAQGSEFRVNTYTTGNQSNPSVALDGAGNFVVAWDSYDQDGSGYGVYAQRYNAAGVAQGAEFRVNTYTNSDQNNPSAALDAAGNFVVAWASGVQDGSIYGVYAQRYNAAGVAQGTEFLVNTFTFTAQYFPSVALDDAGNFVIAWMSTFQDGPSYGVYAQRYNAAGVAQGTEFLVNAYTTLGQSAPSVALDADGDFVVAWQSDGQDGSGYGIYAQRYNAAGVPQGSEFRVNTYTTGHQQFPSVALDAAGNFVVAWSSAQDGSSAGVYAQRFNAAGVAQGAEFRVNTYTTDGQHRPSVALGVGGHSVVAWQSNGQDGSGEGIYAQLYSEPPVVKGLFTDGGVQRVDEGERLVEHPTQLIVAFPDAMSQTGGTSVTSTANWVLTKNGTPLVNPFSSITFALNPALLRYEAKATLVSAMDSGNYVLTLSDAIQNTLGLALDGDADGTAGVAFTRSFTVQSIGPRGLEMQVNTYTTSHQSFSSVAMDSDGDFVVTFQSNFQDGSDDGIYAQRYNAAGVAQGSEFRVNTYTTNSQARPSVAMDADGDFVVSWQSYGQDGNDGYGIYAQRYNAAGVAQGSEFRVNTYTTNSQAWPSVAMDSDGDFVVSWQSNGQDGSFHGIYAQRYNAAGVAQGSEFRVNTYTTSDQYFSSVAMDSDGDFVVTWQSNGQDGSDGYGIYAQRYNAAGVAQGSEFRVNTYTTSDQYFSSVAMDSDGNFVVTWQSNFQDGSIYGIYAQRYNAAGVAQGSEFRVNTYTTNSQARPSVAMDSDGDFVVTWESAGQDGNDGYGIYAQRYNAAGVAQGSEFRVNTYTTASQFDSSIAMDSDGDFVVAWNSFLDQDGSGSGVYAQRYAGITPPTGNLSNVNVLEDAAPSVVDLWADFADAEDADPQLTFSLVANTNPALFASTTISNLAGTLTLTYAGNEEGAAVLTVRATDTGGLTIDVSFTVTVTPVNDAPSFAPGSDVTVQENSGPHVEAGWATTMSAGPPNESGQVLTVQITANDNPSLFAVLPAIDPLTGDLTFTPAASTSGLANISVRLVDDGGTNNSGQDASLTYAFVIEVTPLASISTVVNRQLFYNNSGYDLNAGVDANDDLAIATNKSAYLPGGGAMLVSPVTFPNDQKSFVHLSSFSRGINGLMVDFSGLHLGITVSDFTFKVGANNSPSLWTAPSAAPTSVTLRTTGLGLAPGNTRVEIVWPNNSIRNTWLEVRVKANANTGLSDTEQSPNGDGIGHIFYFGNRVGESGSGNTVSFVTNATDEILARNNPGSGLSVTNRFDYNKDKLVNATDQILARNNPGILTLINIASTPAAPPAAPSALAAGDSLDANPLASALATRSNGQSQVASPDTVGSYNPCRPVALNPNAVDRLFSQLVEKKLPRVGRLLLAADSTHDKIDDAVDDPGCDRELLQAISSPMGRSAGKPSAR